MNGDEINGSCGVCQKVSNYIAFFFGVMDRENFMTWNAIFFKPTAVLSARNALCLMGSIDGKKILLIELFVERKKFASRGKLLN